MSIVISQVVSGTPTPWFVSALESDQAIIFPPAATGMGMSGCVDRILPRIGRISSNNLLPMRDIISGPSPARLWAPSAQQALGGGLDVVQPGLMSASADGSGGAGKKGAAKKKGGVKEKSGAKKRKRSAKKSKPGSLGLASPFFDVEKAMRCVIDGDEMGAVFELTKIRSLRSGSSFATALNRRILFWELFHAELLDAALVFAQSSGNSKRTFDINDVVTVPEMFRYILIDWDLARSSPDIAGRLQHGFVEDPDEDSYAFATVDPEEFYLFRPPVSVDELYDVLLNLMRVGMGIRATHSEWYNIARIVEGVVLPPSLLSSFEFTEEQMDVGKQRGFLLRAYAAVNIEGGMSRGDRAAWRRLFKKHAPRHLAIALYGGQEFPVWMNLFRRKHKGYRRADMKRKYKREMAALQRTYEAVEPHARTTTKWTGKHRPFG